jgi:hypothetical protein
MGCANSGHPHQSLRGPHSLPEAITENAPSPCGAFSVRGPGHNRGVKRWQGLIASGAATLLLLLAMSPSDGTMKENGGPGIVPFEVAGSQSRADEIMGEWGAEGRDAARESLWIDFGFLAAYGTFLTLAIAAVRERARRRGLRRLGAVGAFIAGFGAIGAGFDALENTCLLLTLGGAGSAFPFLAATFAYAKFFFTAIAVAYLVVGAPTTLFRRTPEPADR